MMKKLSALVLALTMLLCALPAHAHEPFMITLAVPEDEHSLLAMTGFYLNDLIDAATGEGILFDVYFEGELGTNEELIDDVLNDGTKVGMLMIPVEELAKRGLSKTAVLTAPYLFSSHEQFLSFASTSRTELLEEFKKHKIKAWGIGFFEGGMVHYPVQEGQGPEDLAQALAQDSHAGVSLISQADPVPAAGDTVVLTGHGMRLYELVMPDNMWQMLIKRERKLMMEICRIGAEYNAKLAAASEERAIAELESRGVRFVRPESLDPWKTALSERIDAVVGGEKKLYQEILKLK